MVALGLAASTIDVLRILLAQALMGFIAALVCGVFAGFSGAASALIGALAYLLPNAVFALRLLSGRKGAASAAPAPAGLASTLTAMAFFVGQFAKLASAITVLILAGWLAPWLIWPAVLSGLACVLMGYALLPFLSWLLRRIPG